MKFKSKLIAFFLVFFVILSVIGLVNSYEFTFEVLNYDNTTRQIDFDTTNYYFMKNSRVNVTLTGVDPEVERLNEIKIHAKDGKIIPFNQLMRVRVDGYGNRHIEMLRDMGVVFTDGQFYDFGVGFNLWS